MKLQFICFISFLYLFSGCSRSAFLIKRKYNKGFYVAHSTKVNQTTLIRFPENKTETALTDLQQDQSAANSCKQDRLEKTSVDPVKILAPLQKLSNTILKNAVSKKTSVRSGNSGTGNTVAASVAMLVVLVAILALVKTFGFIYTLMVCFIIAFTAVAIFFIIRSHLKY